MTGAVVPRAGRVPARRHTVAAAPVEGAPAPGTPGPAEPVLASWGWDLLGDAPFVASPAALLRGVLAAEDQFGVAIIRWVSRGRSWMDSTVKPALSRRVRYCVSSRSRPPPRTTSMCML